MRNASVVVVVAFALFLIPLAASQGHDVVHEAEILRAELEEFASMQVPCATDCGETNIVSYADECNDFFCAYIDSRGWTTNQAVESLMVVVSNLVGMAGTHSNNHLRVCTTEVALNCLERHGSAAQIRAIEPLLLTCDHRIAWLLSRCIVNFKGLGHSAFESYGQLIGGDIPEMNAIRLLGTIGRKIASEKDPRPSEAVTNRYTWLSLSDIGKHPWGAVCNKMLFECWPAYPTSSNRLEALNLCLEQGGMSPSSTNEVLRIRNQLLALHPGTMQMLPTNQFYNVED